MIILLLLIFAGKSVIQFSLQLNSRYVLNFFTILKYSLLPLYISDVHYKLKEVLSLIQYAFDSKDQDVNSLQQFHNLALLQINIPDPSYSDSVKKIIDGISLPSTPYTPFRIITNSEPLPSGYVMVTCMVAT